MNVLFHTITAISVSVLLTDTKRIEQSTTSIIIVTTSISTFALGIISHGVLDYIPHCYPLNSKLDVIISLTLILATLWMTNKKYRLIMALSFIGCIFPDLVDLSPNIINKQFALHLPIIEKIFPWHLHQYSGSIYSGDCNNSTLNHVLLLSTVFIICWFRKTDFKAMFKKSA